MHVAQSAGYGTDRCKRVPLFKHTIKQTRVSLISFPPEMDVHGRLFLISSFVVSFTLSVASKLVQDWAEAAPSPSLESHFRLVSDGAVLVLHFIYLVSSRDSGLGRAAPV